MMRKAGAVIGLLVLGLFGCGAKTGSVSGKVMLNGQPVTGGTVTFLGADQQVATAPIGRDGSYTITKVAVGPAKISVTPPAGYGPTVIPPGRTMMDPSKMGGAADKPGAPPTAVKPVFILERYQHTEKSGLTYTVTGGKQEHTIDLK